MRKDYLVAGSGKIIGEQEVLTNPIFDDAFNAILEKYAPKKSFAIFSLCSKARPFTKSMKWQALIDLFGEECDLIVCSNAGIIPIEYCECYPYMEYDSQSSDPELSDAHKQKFYDRLFAFIKKFKWKRMVGLFSPYEGAAEVWERCYISNGRLFPTVYQYSHSSDPEEFVGYSQRFYKLLTKSSLLSIKEYLGIRAEKVVYKIDHYNRKASADTILREVVDRDLVPGRGYEMAEIKRLLMARGGEFENSYLSKVIKVNCGTGIKYQLKGHDLLRMADGLFYRKDGFSAKSSQKRKLF